MSINLTTQGLLELYSSKKKEQRKLDEFVQNLRDQLVLAAKMGEFDEYLDGETYRLPGLTLTPTKRKTVVYSQAVRDLQEQEVFLGVATEKVTESFTVKLVDG